MHLWVKTTTRVCGYGIFGPLREREALAVARQSAFCDLCNVSTWQLTRKAAGRAGDATAGDAGSCAHASDGRGATGRHFFTCAEHVQRQPRPVRPLGWRCSHEMRDDDASVGFYLISSSQENNTKHERRLVCGARSRARPAGTPNKCASVSTLVHRSAPVWHPEHLCIDPHTCERRTAACAGRSAACSPGTPRGWRRRATTWPSCSPASSACPPP